MAKGIRKSLVGILAAGSLALGLSGCETPDSSSGYMETALIGNLGASISAQNAMNARTQREAEGWMGLSNIQSGLADYNAGMANIAAQQEAAQIQAQGQIDAAQIIANSQQQQQNIPEHVFRTPNGLQPEDGYAWINPQNPNDLRVGEKETVLRNRPGNMYYSGMQDVLKRADREGIATYFSIEKDGKLGLDICNDKFVLRDAFSNMDGISLAFKLKPDEINYAVVKRKDTGEVQKRYDFERETVERNDLTAVKFEDLCLGTSELAPGQVVNYSIELYENEHLKATKDIYLDLGTRGEFFDRR